jgi:CheY-like chemotaxis protein
MPIRWLICRKVIHVCHVLVIEDEPLIADHIGYIAECAGATSVAFARSEDEAMACSREHTPDIILSDVNLKEGGTGPRAVAAIRAANGDVPVIFITGTPEDCEPCDYAAAILGKPLQEQQIKQAFMAVALQE